MNLKKAFKNKKTIFKFVIALTLTSSITLNLASCSSVSDKVKENLVDKGDSQYFASSDLIKISLKDQIYSSLLTKEDFQQFKAVLVGDILYDWYHSKIDSIESFKDNWDKWEKDINKDYDDKIQSYKDSHKNDWEYFFQKEVLDPTGGTKNSYLRTELTKKIRSEFSSLVFSSDDLSLSLDSDYNVRSEILKTPSADTVKNTDNWKKFNYFAQADKMWEDHPFLANTFATLQKSTFEKYMNEVRPVSTAMCLWKYSNPKSGLFSVFDQNRVTPETKKDNNLGDDEGGDEPTTSMTLPTFAEATSLGQESGSWTANDKYWHFAQEWQLTDSFIDSTSGAININKQYTDDSATIMISESNKLFDSLDVSWSGIVADLWSDTTNSTSYLNSYPSSELVIPTTSGYLQTDILDNFYIRNADTSQRATSIKNSKYTIDLSKIYEYTGAANDLETDNFSSLIFNQQTAPYAYKANDKQGVRYITPAIRLQKASATNLPYVIVRDQFGVHVIGLDCAKYISENGGSTIQEKWTAESEVLKFRSISQDIGLDADLGGSMKLNDKLSSFFSSNMDDIILSYVKNDVQTYKDKTTEEKETIFNKKVFDESIYESLMALVDSLTNYYVYYDLISKYDNANKKIYEYSNEYSNNSIFIRITGNKVIDTTGYKNGLVCPLPFMPTSGNTSSQNILQQTINYNEAKMMYGFDTKYLNGQNPENITKDILNSLKQDTKTKFDAYWTAGNFQPNTSKASTAKYSEIITVARDKDTIESDLNTADAINACLHTYGNKTDLFSNIIKTQAYESYWKSAYPNLETDFANQITSLFKTAQVFSSSENITYFKNDAALSNVSELTQLINNAYDNQNNRDVTFTDYSQAKLTYQTLLASIYFLTKDNYQNLINELIKDIDANTSAVIAWDAKDYSELNADFAKEAAETQSGSNTTYENIFGYNSNYLGAYDYIYKNINLSEGTVPYTKGFIKNDSYWNFAQMPYLSGRTTKSINAMGFVGLQTSKSSSNLPTEVSNILFNKNDKKFYNCVVNNSSDNGYGSLYAYKSKENLKNMITSSWSIEEIKSASEYISIAIPTNNTFEKINSQIQDGKKSDGTKLVTADDYRNLLLEAFEPSANVFKDSYFYGYNFAQSSTGSQALGAAQLKSSLSSEGCAIHTTNGADRVYAIQINHYDLLEDASYSSVSQHLIDLLGGETIGKSVLNSLVVQYAMKSTIQTRALDDVIKQVFGDNKVIVYDRRLNDALGQDWVQNWKKTI